MKCSPRGTTLSFTFILSIAWKWSVQIHFISRISGLLVRIYGKLQRAFSGILLVILPLREDRALHAITLAVEYEAQVWGGWFATSASHRPVWVGRHNWRSSSPRPLQQKQGASSTTLCCSKFHPNWSWLFPGMMYPTDSLGNLCQCFTTLIFTRLK